MIMNNKCKINEEYSTLINLQNEFKLRRLTVQECTVNNNIIIPGQKQYSFTLFYLFCTLPYNFIFFKRDFTIRQSA